jgi:hypothetical protein
MGGLKMLEYIGLVIILSAIFAILLLHKPKSPHKCDESCRYFGRNITQEPCMYCEDESEWQESDMKGQEWD